MKSKSIPILISLKTKKLLYIFSLFIFIFGNAFIHSNTSTFTTNDECMEVIEYDLDIITQYHLPVEDAPKLTQLELARIKKTTEKQSIKICLTEDDLIKEISMHNPEEIFPEWMPKIPTKTVITKKGTAHFSELGQLIHKREHSDKEKTYTESKRLIYEEKGMFVDSWYKDNPSEMADDLIVENEFMDNIVQTEDYYHVTKII